MEDTGSGVQRAGGVLKPWTGERAGLGWLRLGLLLLALGCWLAQTRAQPAAITQKCGSYAGPLLPLQTASPAAENPPAPLALHTRLGFGLSNEANAAWWARRLGAGWYLDWRVRVQRPTAPLERWQMVRLGPECVYPPPEWIRWAAQRVPGQVWVIGNEPDVIWQDNLAPEAYALRYGELYRLIKSADPTARVAPAAISQVTPLRLAYLERVLAAYAAEYGHPLPADWWTVHAFVLREQRDSWGVGIPPGMADVERGQLYEIGDHGRLDLFQAQLVEFRRWLAAHGYQNRPLALTEYGILMPAEYGYPPELVAGYLHNSFAWLETAHGAHGYPPEGGRLVQRWAWFSLSDRTYPGSDLVDLRSNRLTAVGEAFRRYALDSK